MENLATSMRRRKRPLAERLRAEPFAFEALQLIHLLERLAPDRAPVGTRSDPIAEAAILRGSFARRFPPSEVEAVRWPETGPPEVTIASFGLAGALGPLPTPLSEAVAEAARRGQTAARDFLDIANHRLIAKFLALGRRRWPHTEPGAPAEGETAGVLGAVMGLPPRRPDADRALLPLAGLLSRRPIGVDALERALTHLLAEPVRVRPFVGRWVRFGDGEQARLGRQGARLGRRGAALGGGAYDVQAAIAVRIGPMTALSVRSLLPGGGAHPTLRRHLAFLLDRRADVELDLITRAEEVPRAVLGRPHTSRLGWNAWLGGKSADEVGRTRLRLELRRGDGSG